MSGDGEADDDRRAGYEYALGAAHSAAMAAFVTAQTGEEPPEGVAAWDERDEDDFYEGARRAVRDIALLEAEHRDGGGDDEDDAGSCPECGGPLFDAMGGPVCPEHGEPG